MSFLFKGSRYTHMETLMTDLMEKTLKCCYGYLNSLAGYHSSFQVVRYLTLRSLLSVLTAL